MDSKHWILARVTQGPNLLPVLGSSSFYLIKSWIHFSHSYLTGRFAQEATFFLLSTLMLLKIKKKLQYHMNDGGGEGGERGAETAKIIITPPCSGLTCQTFPFLLPLSSNERSANVWMLWSHVCFPNCYSTSHPALALFCTRWARICGASLWRNCW